MKKPKRRLTKAGRERREHKAKLARREEALLSIYYTVEELVRKLNALGDFDANAPHVRSLAAAVALLYRDRVGDLG